MKKAAEANLISRREETAVMLAVDRTLMSLSAGTKFSNASTGNLKVVLGSHELRSPLLFTACILW